MLELNAEKCISHQKMLKQIKFECIFDSNTIFANNQPIQEKQQKVFNNALKKIITLMNRNKIKVFGQLKE